MGKKFKRGDRVRVIIAEYIRAGGELRSDDELEVIRRNKETGGIRVKHVCGESEFYIMPDELQYLERIYRRPSKKKRIERLEVEVAELRRIVQDNGLQSKSAMSRLMERITKR